MSKRRSTSTHAHVYVVMSLTLVLREEAAEHRSLRNDHLPHLFSFSESSNSQWHALAKHLRGQPMPRQNNHSSLTRGNLVRSGDKSTTRNQCPTCHHRHIIDPGPGPTQNSYVVPPCRLLSTRTLPLQQRIKTLPSLCSPLRVPLQLQEDASRLLGVNGIIPPRVCIPPITLPRPPVQQCQIPPEYRRGLLAGLNETSG